MTHCIGEKQRILLKILFSFHGLQETFAALPLSLSLCTIFQRQVFPSDFRCSYYRMFRQLQYLFWLILKLLDTLDLWGLMYALCICVLLLKLHGSESWILVSNYVLSRSFQGSVTGSLSDIDDLTSTFAKVSSLVIMEFRQ